MNDHVRRVGLCSARCAYLHWSKVMSHWVKFHSELTKGAKRGLSRATRFVYMELSLHARELGGAIDLPPKGDLVDVVHDVIGGDRREVKDALATLTQAEPDDEPMVSVVVGSGRRGLVVSSWTKWNRLDDSNDRVKRHREKRAKMKLAGNDSVTRYKTASNASETRLDQRRSDQRREEKQKPCEPMSDPATPPARVLGGT